MLGRPARRPKRAAWRPKCATHRPVRTTRRKGGRVGARMGGVGSWGVVGLAAAGGVGAGVGARVVLARLRWPVRLPRGVAEVAMGGLWAVVAARIVQGG